MCSIRLFKLPISLKDPSAFGLTKIVEINSYVSRSLGIIIHMQFLVPCILSKKTVFLLVDMRDGGRVQIDQN